MTMPNTQKNLTFSRLILLIGLMIGMLSCKQSLEVKSISTTILPLQSNQEGDSSFQIKKLIQPYKDCLEEDMNRIIGHSSQRLWRAKPEGHITNFVADLMLQETTDYCKENTIDFIPQIAIVNIHGLRAPIPKGPITLKNAFELMPFENRLSLLKLKGEALEKLLHYFAQKGGEGVGGVKMGIKDGKATNIKIEGKAIQQDSIYHVVVSDYLANGGDGMTALTQTLFRKDLNLLLRDAIISHCEKLNRQGKSISVKLDRRVYHVE